MHRLITLRQQFHFTFPDEPERMDLDLFDYGPLSRVRIVVQRILRNPRVAVKKGVILDAMKFELSEGTEYTVHKGYHHVLLGFRREIRFITEGGEDRKINNLACISRAQYLIKVLDRFAEELQEMRMQAIKQNVDVHLIDVSPGPRFRSMVLNPILQRQLRGLDDHDVQPLQSVINNSIVRLVEVYLQEDPLDKALGQRYLRNLLYITPVRFSLAYFSSDATQEHFDKLCTNTEFLKKSREDIRDDNWDRSILYDFEIEVIKAEKLQDLYANLIDASVSNHFHLLTHTSSKINIAHSSSCGGL
jgi:hypothetical protein